MSESRPSLRDGAVALLVLLAAPARTRRVPRHLVGDRLRRRAGVGGAAARRRLVPVLHLDALGPRPGRLVLAHELDAIDVADEPILDRGRELVEHRERLATVLGE